MEWWPTGALPGPLKSDLPLPSQFEAAAKLVTEEELAKRVPCGPDPERHVKAIREFIDAGFSHVYIHQIGPDQEGFCRFYEREILPHVRAAAA
jgi:hypothetical protein